MDKRDSYNDVVDLLIDLSAEINVLQDRLLVLQTRIDSTSTTLMRQSNIKR